MVPETSSRSNGLSHLKGPPVFITGAPKAGKSALLEVFRRLEDFYTVVEPLSTWRIGSHSNEDDCRTALDATDNLKQVIRDDVLRKCHAANVNRYADDMSHHALQIPFLREVYPDARIVVVTRDPQYFLPEALYFWTLKPSLIRAARIRWRGLRLSTLISLASRFFRNMVANRRQGRLNTWGAIVPGQKAFASTHSVVELAAYQWATLYATAMESAKQDKAVHFVTFEDLVHSPRETTEEILRFCQTPVTPEILDFADNYFDPNFFFPKRKELTEAQWRLAWPILREVAERLGYEPPQ